MRRPLIAGNWKMNGSHALAAELLSSAVVLVAEHADREVLVAPPYTLLEQAARTLSGTGVRLAAQNLFWEKDGAYTGEVSAAMLLEAGCTHVIIGHSERRHYFGESNDSANKRVRAALAAELAPILCVGETLAEREGKATMSVIERQVREGLAGIERGALPRVTLAYEPVWAIGTGKVATPQQAQEVHRAIRGLLLEIGGGGAATECRILYGGSVKPDNIDTLMAEADVDGALVGGASLQAEAFARIVRFQR